MGVFLNKTFNDGSVVAIWQITDSDGKSLNEQRLAVSALIDSVFEGKFQLRHDEEGVPFLKAPESCGSDNGDGDPSPAPFVSISHTRGWVAAMTSPKKHVGIDIELSNRDFSAVGKKALSDSELSRLDYWATALVGSKTMNGNPPESDFRNLVLGLIWCAKEAVYKRLTVPATDFANQIEIECITPTATDKVEITAIFKDKTGSSKIHLNCLLLPDLILIHTID